LAQKFGQHFLTNPAILDRIAHLICGAGKLNVLEIGPGRGALTERLIARASHVTAVEIDPELTAYLRSRFGGAPNLELVNADALDVDLGAYNPEIVAGNLPYYVATPLIERTVRAGLPGVFLIQKEVALRLAARPGSRDYGFLTVQTQLFSKPELMFTVPPGAFKPVPKVDSAVVALQPRDGAAELGIRDPEPFLSFLSACFRQKRKTLRNNLRAEFPIDGQPEAQLRAEQLSLDDLAGLWRRLTLS
jgi:16S rRNA (adenine1518-N6/adenine1519-N6)-dimethyltransferase